MRGVFEFEGIDKTLPLLPLAARRALDVAGRKLSLGAWRKLAIKLRERLVVLGSEDNVDAAAVLEALAEASPPPEAIAAADDCTRVEPGGELLSALGEAAEEMRRLWSGLKPLEQFALLHLARRKSTDRLAVAYREICGGRLLAEQPRQGLTHLTARGEAQMVDVGDKPTSLRRALARAVVKMKPDTAREILDGRTVKGDVLAAARIAGIMAAKRTPELIPLCHAIALTRVSIELDVQADEGQVVVKATSEARDRTGVEMEAMVAASIAALTIYDMLKAVDRAISVEELVLLEKSGGRSGHYRREGAKGE